MKRSGIFVVIVLTRYGGWGKSDTLKKVGDRTVYGTDKPNDNKEEV